MIISLRLSEIDAELVKRSAMNQGVSVSSFIRETIMGRIDCEFRELFEKEEVMQEEQKE